MTGEGAMIRTFRPEDVVTGLRTPGSISALGSNGTQTALSGHVFWAETRNELK